MAEKIDLVITADGRERSALEVISELKNGVYLLPMCKYCGTDLNFVPSLSQKIKPYLRHNKGVPCSHKQEHIEGGSFTRRSLNEAVFKYLIKVTPAIITKQIWSTLLRTKYPDILKVDYPSYSRIVRIKCESLSAQQFIEKLFLGLKPASDIIKSVEPRVLESSDFFKMYSYLLAAVINSNKELIAVSAWIASQNKTSRNLGKFVLRSRIPECSPMFEKLVQNTGAGFEALKGYSVLTNFSKDIEALVQFIDLLEVINKSDLSHLFETSPQHNRDKMGFIYLIKRNLSSYDPLQVDFKIGFSTDPLIRLNTILGTAPDPRTLLEACFLFTAKNVEKTIRENTVIELKNSGFDACLKGSSEFFELRGMSCTPLVEETVLNLFKGECYKIKDMEQDILKTVYNVITDLP